MKNRLLLLWIVLEAAALGYIFGAALWGGKLLAPLDTAPALFSKYRFVDPSSSGIPANHHIVDQLTYDLPLQKTIYHAYRDGEMPWWDPYNYGGRPLLADAHINGTDPLRCLFYAILPFELAYNWTLIAHSLLAGISMLILLRFLGFPDWSSVILALTYQFSMALVLHFGHPWVAGAFAWYPFLWIAWDKWLRTGSWIWIATAGIWIAAIVYSGNLQSHSYLSVFALAFLLGYGGLQKNAWMKILVAFIASFSLGFSLAAPVLISQIELFFTGSRPLDTSFTPATFLGGIASFSAIYPWALGTFRTLDLSKFAGQMFHFGFALYIGSAAIGLSFLGAQSPAPSQPRLQPVRRTALWLVAFYLLIASTPLVKILYLRSSGLAAIALTVLAAIGLATALENPDRFRREGRWVLVLALSCAIVTNVFAFLVYPRLLPRVKDMVLRSPRGISAPALRAFQVQNFPAETSFLNPETVLATGSLLLLSFLLLAPRFRHRPGLWTTLLIVNAIPVLLYAHRFIPRQPLVLWERLLQGGPEQKEVIASLGNTPFRLYEGTLNLNDRLFPNAMSHLYNVRTFHGYAALRPAIFKLPQFADYSYETPNDNIGSGELFSIPSESGYARFRWINPITRTFRVEQSGLNQIKFFFDPGQKGTLLWTDARYPGWRGFLDGHSVELEPHGICFNIIQIPENARQLTLSFRPRFLWLSINIAVLALTATIFLFLVSRRRRPGN